ncbi:hypothetical protein TVAG_530130 [Trichomonas vaginalis G3]|uniref:Uncharacterized protein n=2 Tax=Trichomonas vaginalis (strain ATCC PRA-98 / G3) TaxID=412133 RepID=A2GEI0_TRIV3|nr:hypothetical protein TVAGG3_0286390 [Trichomonas vaginalis G3]EAX84435.1 hypothetical protein TVAG_530130 [Trichomonas vaginalis G3]KAI5526931.1 hypothetical protein TVAGG3_0286390 [Trichomonas vaginalis G3]|eukprot:XP_001297365.1 hypothetical protein [Trichomonas vaginalis G3]
MNYPQKNQQIQGNMQYDPKNRMYASQQMYLDMHTAQIPYQNSYKSPHSSKVAILQTPQMMMTPQQQLNQNLVNQIPFQTLNAQQQAYISQAILSQQSMMQANPLTSQTPPQLIPQQNLAAQQSTLLAIQPQYQTTRGYDHTKRLTDSAKQKIDKTEIPQQVINIQTPMTPKSTPLDSSPKNSDEPKTSAKQNLMFFTPSPPTGCFTIVRRGNLPEIRFEYQGL